METKLVELSGSLIGDMKTKLGASGSLIAACLAAVG
jgi:hypothetical protein